MSCLVAKMEIEIIDFVFPQWLTSSIKALNQHMESLKTCEAMCRLRQAKKFSQNYPVISLVLAFTFAISFFPIFAFMAFISGSFVVILFTALTIFGGVFVASLVPFLTVLFPILILGGTAAVILYFTYCTVVRVLQIIHRLTDMVMSLLTQVLAGAMSLPYEILRWVMAPLLESDRIEDCEVKPESTEELDQNDAFVPTEEESAYEELCDEELFYSSDD
ncbi:hypothetical protein OS493_029098 [Desmophyllum pertusum]|uniref:Uncharacterized protein n=1 Tax=Desmophyllum pertusum TaxID=174260 RepID=A0A9X0CF28_9CNID|nr:hypothetical protein OS493_029098 [Desmophyllum pertusum]